MKEFMTMKFIEENNTILEKNNMLYLVDTLS